MQTSRRPNAGIAAADYTVVGAISLVVIGAVLMFGGQLRSVFDRAAVRLPSEGTAPAEARLDPHYTSNAAIAVLPRLESLFLRPAVVEEGR